MSRARDNANTSIFGTPSVTLGSDATGDVYYRAAGGALTRLATGADGTVLTSTGVGAVPAFEASAVGGKILSIEKGTFPTDTTITDTSNYEGFGMGLQWARNASASEFVINTNALIDRLYSVSASDSYRFSHFNLYLRSDSSALSVIGAGTDVSGGSLQFPDLDTGVRFGSNIDGEMGDQLYQNFQLIVSSATAAYYAVDLVGKALNKNRYAICLNSTITVLQSI